MILFIGWRAGVKSFWYIMIVFLMLYLISNSTNIRQSGCYTSGMWVTLILASPGYPCSYTKTISYFAVHLAIFRMFFDAPEDLAGVNLMAQCVITDNLHSTQADRDFSVWLPTLPHSHGGGVGYPGSFLDITWGRLSPRVDTGWPLKSGWLYLGMNRRLCHLSVICL